MSEDKKKKKGLGGKKPNSRKQQIKTLAHYRSKGIPLGFIQDSIISGYGKEVPVTRNVGGRNVIRTADEIVEQDLGGAVGEGKTKGFFTRVNMRDGTTKKRWSMIEKNPNYDRSRPARFGNFKYRYKVRNFTDAFKQPQDKAL